MGYEGWLYPAFEQRVVQERGDKNIIMNCDGLLAEVPKDGYDTIPHYIKASVVTPDDWARVKTERFDVSDPTRYPDVADVLSRHPNDRDYPLSISCGSMIGNAYFDTIEPLVKRGGYIPFCDHRCPPNVTPADYLYYLDEKERRFGMK